MAQAKPRRIRPPSMAGPKKQRTTGLRPLPNDRRHGARMPTAPPQTAIRHFSLCNMGRFATPNGTFCKPERPISQPTANQRISPNSHGRIHFLENERQTAEAPLRQNEPVAPQVGRRAWRRRSGLRRDTAADKMQARARKRLGSMMAAIKQAQGGQKGDLG